MIHRIGIYVTLFTSFFSGFLGIGRSLIAEVEEQYRIPLRLEMTTESPVVAYARMTDGALMRAALALDAKAAELGWHYMDYSVTTEGYVETRHMGKDLTLSSSALLYTAPSKESKVIKRLNAYEELGIAATDDDEFDFDRWIKVQYTGPVTVYFQLDEKAATTLAQSDSGKVASSQNPEAFIPQNQARSTQPRAIAGELKKFPHSSARNLIGPSFEGYIVRSKGHIINTNKRQSEYELRDGIGARSRLIARVSDEKLVTKYPLSDLVGKKVQIQGVRSQNRQGNTIHATHLRVISE